MKWLNILKLIVMCVVGFPGIALATSNHVPIDPAYYAETVMQMEARYEIPHGLLFEMCKTESNFKNVVGDQGKAIGLCQVHANTVVEVAGGNPYSGDSKLYALGSRGTQVAAIQAALVGAGYDLQVDGIYGTRTRDAVRSFQARAKEGLVVDGIVGPRTWARLGLGVYPGKTITQALWNEDENIEWAARILRYRFEQCGHGSWALAIAAYNGGCGNAVVVHTGRVLDDWKGKIVYIQEENNAYPLGL